MAQVTVRINGYSYSISCEDGQESHLQAMAAEIESRIKKIKAIVGQGSESRLLVIAGLMLADELHDLRLELAAIRGLPGKEDPAFGERLVRLASRAEAIAASLERT